MAEILGWEQDDYRTVAIYQDEALPPIDTVKRIIITGSGAMVADSDPWISESAKWLAQAAKRSIPILGICFGHQLLAHALGGKVGNNPRGLEVGSVSIHLTEDASEDSLFKGMPSQFTANVSHMQSVIRLPDGARLLAYSDIEKVHAFGYGSHIWGIQFHPEFDGEIVKHFIRYFDEQLQREGRDIDTLIATACDSSDSRELLRRFAQIDSKCQAAPP